MEEAPFNLSFTGIPSFCRAPICTDLSRLDADVAVLGIPFDEGQGWKPGARFGPRRIRELSLKFAIHSPTGETGGFYDPDEDRTFLEYEARNRRLWDCGDVDVIFTNVEETFEGATAAVRTILERGALPVILGGDHSITFPVVRAYDEPIQVVQFDAHMDYARPRRGVSMANGNPLFRCSELLSVGKMAHLGIRGIRNPKLWFEEARERGNTIVTGEQWRLRGSDYVIQNLPVGGKTYVTIDIDVLDSGLIPGCASGEPGGPDYPELRKVLSALAERTQVVGFDLVEVNPMLDPRSDLTSQLAAQVVLEFLGRVVANADYLQSRGRLPAGTWGNAG